MRLAFLTTLTVVPATAGHAHPGHLADLVGHDHWVAGAAIGLAIALGVWGVLKGGRKAEAEADQTDEDTDGQEAEA